MIILESLLEMTSFLDIINPEQSLVIRERDCLSFIVDRHKQGHTEVLYLKQQDNYDQLTYVVVVSGHARGTKYHYIILDHFRM